MTKTTDGRLQKSDLTICTDDLLEDPWNTKSIWCMNQHRTTNLAYCRVSCGKKCKQVKELLSND